MTEKQSPVRRVTMSGRASDGESQRWLAVLSHDSPERGRALSELHGLLLRAARAELHRRGDRVRVSGPELDDLAHQAAADGRQ